eukprot:1545856-Prymnesium_polylepis.1
MGLGTLRSSRRRHLRASRSATGRCGWWRTRREGVTSSPPATSPLANACSRRSRLCRRSTTAWSRQCATCATHCSPRAPRAHAAAAA